MNIKITHNWLLEYLETDASPYEIQKCLSLCGPSVEKVEKIGDDYIYDIEITSNRIDCASVYGIAREATAILNRFGIEAKLKPLNLVEPKVATDRLPLHIIDPDLLCRRILGVVIENVQIGKSPEYIKNKLERCGIRSLNNLIDVTNYVMLELGHPTHVFDYDRVKTGNLILRKAKKGEKLLTLDNKDYILSENDVVIDDGTGRIIDLPGIMGTANSVVTPQTRRIIFFIESNNPIVIRKTSMRLGIRTLAATINEKQPDPEMTKLAFIRGIDLFQQLAGGKCASKLYDIYLKPYKTKTLDIRYSIFEEIIGIKIVPKTIYTVLRNLGFKLMYINKGHDKIMRIEIPSYRKDDINIKEDIVEEVARLYGYHNLPNNLQPPVYVKQPEEIEKLFIFQPKIKYFLKHLGLHEVMNYSMISKETIKNFGLVESDHLRLFNAISEEIEYMRISLLPSLVKNIKDNFGKKEILKLFEIAKVYYPRKNNLPEEVYKLGIIVNTDFFDLKGIIEALLTELNIEGYQLTVNSYQLLNIFHPKIRVALILKDKLIGYLGQLKPELKLKNNLKTDVFLAEIDFQSLIYNYRIVPTYKPINPFALIKLDLTINLSEKINFATIQNLAFKNSKLLQKIEVVDVFKNKITLRFYFSSLKQNISENEAKEELKKILRSVILEGQTLLGSRGEG